MKVVDFIDVEGALMTCFRLAYYRGSKNEETYVNRKMIQALKGGESVILLQLWLVKSVGARQ